MTTTVVEANLNIAMPAHAADLRGASLWLWEMGGKYSIPAEQIERLDLSLTEALANVVDHGGSQAENSPIHLHFALKQQAVGCELVLSITDSGLPFDPLAAPVKPRPQTLDEAEPGGLGIAMMRSFTDDLRYQYRDGRNLLAMTVRWDASSVASAKTDGVQIRRFGRKSDSGSSGTETSDGAWSVENERRHLGIGWLPLFNGTDEQAVLKILSECDVLLLPAGTPLLKPGAANDAIFVLLSGHLVAHLDSDLNPDVAIQLDPGECIGELSAIDGKPVTALVVAVTEARVLKLTPELFLNRLLTTPGVARNLLVVLTERMRRTNETMLASQRRQLDLQHLRKELEVARELQASMLPLRRPMFPERDDIEVAALMEAASEVGGDLFDAFFIDDHTMFICIGDVSGHGVPAALFMARAIGLVRIAAMGKPQPGELIQRVNEQLCIGNETNLFITLFCGYLHIPSGRLVYSNGGHCAPMILNQGNITRLPLPKGALVGAIPGLGYTSREVVLEKGETLVCFTDGVTEAQPPSGEEFSEERLAAVLRRMMDRPLEAMMDAVRQEVSDFTGDNALEDDCTLLAIRRIVA